MGREVWIVFDVQTKLYPAVLEAALWEKLINWSELKLTEKAEFPLKPLCKPNIKMTSVWVELG